MLRTLCSCPSLAGTALPGLASFGQRRSVAADHVSGVPTVHVLYLYLSPLRRRHAPSSRA